MKKIILGTITAVLSFALYTEHAVAETLNQASQQAVQTNPEVLRAADRTLVSREAIDVAKGGYLPKLDLSAAAGRERSRNSSTRTLTREHRTLTRQESNLLATQEVFTGFATKYEVDRTKNVHKSDLFLLANSAEDIALNAAVAYLNVLRYEELVRIGKANLAELEHISSMVQSRSEAGISKEADAVQAQARIALGRANLNSSEGNLREARVTYLKLVGHMPGKLGYPKFNDRLLPKNLKTAIDIAVKNHPTLNSAMADVDAAKAQHMERYATNYPHFSVQLSSQRNTNIDGSKGTDYEDSAMFRMSYNLFNGGADAAEQRRTAYAVEEAKEVRDNTYRQVKENMGLAWTAMNTNRELMKYYARQRDENKKTVEAYADQFKLGQRTLLDLLNVQNEYYTASTSYINAKADELVSKYRIMNGMGKMLHTIHMQAKTPVN